MMTPLEARLTEEVAALRAENKLLREKVDLLIRRIFGRSGEQLDDGQLMLLLQGGDDGAKKVEASSANPGVLEAEIDKRDKDNKPVKPRRQREARVPEHLPAVDEVIEPEEVTAAPEAWRRIGEEITEQLDYEPARFFRRRIIRKKYVKRDEPHQGCSHRSSSRSIAITSRSTGRSRSTPPGTTSPSHGKAWRAGSDWPPIGCDRFMSTSTPASWPEAMCRSTRHPSSI